jgi:hypothetical protein
LLLFLPSSSAGNPKLSSLYAMSSLIMMDISNP